MKNKLKAPVLFIIVGLPGSGKTQLSRYLARRLRLHKVHDEKVSSALKRAKVSLAPPKKLVFGVSLLLIEEFARLKTSVVCDVAAERDSLRQDLYNLARKHRLQPIVIYQQVDLETSWLRYQDWQRSKTPDLQKRRQQFELLTQNLQPPTSEKIITVSGVHSLEVQLQIILCKLLEMQLLVDDRTHLKKIAKPGLINLIASCYKRPMSKNLPIALSSNLKLGEEN